MFSRAAHQYVMVSNFRKFVYRRQRHEVLAGGVQLVKLGQRCRAEIGWDQALTLAVHRTKPEVALNLTLLYERIVFDQIDKMRTSQ
jgi:hypothetical protein